MMLPLRLYPLTGQTEQLPPRLVEGRGVVAPWRPRLVAGHRRRGGGRRGGLQRVLRGGQDLELERALGEVYGQTRDEGRF